MNDRIIPVILSGGSGTRLWPLSRPERPKQLLAVTEERTMLQLTAARTVGADFQDPIIVGSTIHAEEIGRQLGEIGQAARSLILEPIARNTAPAIALAALAIGGDQTPLLVMPSDHVIGDVAAFHQAVARALPFARDGWLVTFGIEPTGPETGYGYIREGAALGDGVLRADRFVEKPSMESAVAMLAGGDHVWNGGIFLFRADTYLEALHAHAPEILAAAEHAMTAAMTEGNHIHPDASQFASAPSISVDNAVMELSDRVAVVPVAMGWSDVGSWDALYEMCEADDRGNVVQGDVIQVDAANSLIRTNGIRIAAVGIADLIVVAHGNDVLIMPKGRSQDVKRLLDLWPSLLGKPANDGS